MPDEPLKPGEKATIETLSGSFEVEQTETGKIFRGLHPSDANDTHEAVEEEVKKEVDQMTAYKAAEKAGVTPGQLDALHREAIDEDVTRTREGVLKEFRKKFFGR